MQTIVDRVDNLLGGIEQGKGNIGKLLKDEELYDRLNGIAAEGQKLLSDVRTANGTMSKLIYDDTLYQRTARALEAHRRRCSPTCRAARARRASCSRTRRFTTRRSQSLTEIHALLDGRQRRQGHAPAS